MIAPQPRWLLLPPSHSAFACPLLLQPCLQAGTSRRGAEHEEPDILRDELQLYGDEFFHFVLLCFAIGALLVCYHYYADWFMSLGVGLLTFASLETVGIYFGLKAEADG
ncbi:Transmembrane protein 40 [Tupaia chinensis]|uniref:Transmembrane protein 40 n=1 Tax=Tupaia chinensis TaxID=246437 RepID=L9J8Q4_TUPCH|nr:Transmembrane protein 40 [Tupaia chinensis]